jgi:cell division protein FtsW (lipid II flippase)
MMYVLAGIVIWTIISFWFFFLVVLPYKFRKDKWYDGLLLAPFLVVLKLVAILLTGTSDRPGR